MTHTSQRTLDEHIELSPILAAVIRQLDLTSIGACADLRGNESPLAVNIAFEEGLTHIALVLRGSLTSPAIGHLLAHLHLLGDSATSQIYYEDAHSPSEPEVATAWDELAEDIRGTFIAECERIGSILRDLYDEVCHACALHSPEAVDPRDNRHVAHPRSLVRGLHEPELRSAVAEIEWIVRFGSQGESRNAAVTRVLREFLWKSNGGFHRHRRSHSVVWSDDAVVSDEVDSNAPKVCVPLAPANTSSESECIKQGHSMQSETSSAEQSSSTKETAAPSPRYLIDVREQYPFDGLSPIFIKQCLSALAKRKRRTPSPFEADDDAPGE